MAFISTTAYGPSYTNHIEDPSSLPHREESTIWVPSEIHSPLSINDLCLSILVPTQSNDPQPAYGNDNNGHPEEIIGRAVPTITLSLGQSRYTSSLDQGREPGPFPLSHLSEPSHPSMEYHVVANDITIDPRLWECIPIPGGPPTYFPITARNSIFRPDVLDDYQPSRDTYTNQEPSSDGTPAVFTASPGVTVMSPFNQTPGGFLVVDPSLSSLVNSGATPPSRTTYQTEGRQPTFGQLGQTDQSTSTPSASIKPIQGVTVNQYRRRHQCTMCDADYSLVSGLNRHLTEKHLPWMACDFCDFQYPLGRKYLLTRHLETDHPDV